MSLSPENKRRTRNTAIFTASILSLLVNYNKQMPEQQPVRVPADATVIDTKHLKGTMAFAVRPAQAHEIDCGGIDYPIIGDTVNTRTIWGDPDDPSQDYYVFCKLSKQYQKLGHPVIEQTSLTYAGHPSTQ